MGVRRRKETEEFQIPDEIARDVEVASMIADHATAADPHPQYLLERAFALLTHGILGSSLGIPGSSATPFNANMWNPNQGQAHASAVNIAAVGIGSSIQNSNLPNGSQPGLIVELDPFLGTAYANFGKTQFFFYYPTSASPCSLWIRQQIIATNSWDAWQRMALDGGLLADGIQIGASGTPIKKVLSRVFTIDPASVAADSAEGFGFSVPGATPGDTVFISPIGGDLWNTSIWPFEFVGYCNGLNSVVLLLRNEWTGALDLAPFQVRVVVIGF